MDRIAMALAYDSSFVKQVRDNTTVMIIALNRGTTDKGE